MSINSDEPGKEAEHAPHPEQIANPETMYERRDLSSRAILGFLIALAIAGLLMHLALWSMYKYVVGPQNISHAPKNPLVISNRELRPMGDPAVTFPAPRLQPNEPADMNKFRGYEEQILNSYGWVDQPAGIAHIPIDKAMDIIAHTGLPTRPAPPQTAGPPPELPSGGVDAAPKSGP
ncbi:MAG TPA: hypothetical protein VGA61_06475 [Anaerolineae bacterium]